MAQINENKMKDVLAHTSTDVVGFKIPLYIFGVGVYIGVNAAIVHTHQHVGMLATGAMALSEFYMPEDHILLGYATPELIQRFSDMSKLFIGASVEVTGVDDDHALNAQYGKGLLVGAITAYVAIKNCQFSEAVEWAKQYLPNDLDRLCVPDSWHEDFEDYFDS